MSSCDNRVYTPHIVYKVAICPRGNLPYIQINSIVLPYCQSTNYLVGIGTYLSKWKSTLYLDHLYSEPYIQLPDQRSLVYH